MTCSHRGPCRGIKVYLGKASPRESLRVCHHPELQPATGKRISCLPTFAGELVENMRGVVLQCALCRYREEAT